MRQLIIRTNLRAGQITMYGTEWCKWTKKQRDYLTNKGISFTFVDCDKGQCPAHVSGFPTMDKDGEILVGYREL